VAGVRTLLRDADTLTPATLDTLAGMHSGELWPGAFVLLSYDGGQPLEVLGWGETARDALRDGLAAIECSPEEVREWRDAGGFFALARVAAPAGWAVVEGAPVTAEGR
jgi:hypothetical protein